MKLLALRVLSAVLAPTVTLGEPMKLVDSPVDGIIELSIEDRAKSMFLNAAHVVRVVLYPINDNELEGRHGVRIITTETLVERVNDGGAGISKDYSFSFEGPTSARDASAKLLAEIRAAK